MSAPAPLKQTPLNAVHREMGARMVDFGGWDMPVQYTGVIEEHLAARNAAGLFDVSHMGEIEVRGEGARAWLDWLTPNDVGKLAPGRVQYSALTRPDGTFVDDILVYCRGAEDFLLVVNAGNTDKDFAWIQAHPRPGATARNVSADYSQIAIQGPCAAEILERALPGLDLSAIGYYHFVVAEICGDRNAILSRTGYTGEDGFEVYLEADRGALLWKQLLGLGEKQGIRACGLGARDTLRLEAKLPLYGNDIDESTTVIEADLGWVVKLGKGDFIGRDVLAAQKQSGAPRRLVGFEMIDRGIARHGYPLRLGGRSFGAVTSGTYSPYLEKNVGLAYLPSEQSAVGTEIEVEIRSRWLRAKVVATPFVPHRTLGAKSKRI